MTTGISFLTPERLFESARVAYRYGGSNVDIEIAGGGTGTGNVSWNWSSELPLPDVRDAARLHGGLVTDIGGSTFAITLRWDQANTRWDMFRTDGSTTSALTSSSWSSSRLRVAQFNLPIIDW